MEACNQALAEAMQLEKQGEAAMVRRRQAAAEALHQVQTAADAAAAYGVPESLPAPSVLHCEG